MNSEPEASAVKPTPLERVLGSVYRGGMVALGVTVLGMVVYLVGGYVSIRFDLIDLSYPFLSVSGDPILLFLLSAGGLFITVAMLGRVFFVMLRPGLEEDILLFVLLGFIAIGFGLSAFYYALDLLIELVGL